MNTSRSASTVVLAAALLALTTACGQEQADEPNGRSVGNAAPAAGSYADGYGPGADAGGEAEAKSAGQLAVWKSKKLGDVVTDSAGFTLYRFDKDTAEPPKSSCSGECATTWPVVAADGAKATPGVDAGLVGSVTREDGSEQLTIGGWPMYRHAADKKPGDAEGQGVGGTWFAAAPDGKKAAVGGGAEAGGDEADQGAGAGELPGLSTRTDPELGEIVVDKDGRTVYRFKKDSAWPMKSACTGDCLDSWPAVKPVAKNDTKGVLKKGFVVFNRPDGIEQQTINCWPLYTFSGDNEPGEINGQGVGGTWYAVSPQGKLVGAPK